MAEEGKHLDSDAKEEYLDPDHINPRFHASGMDCSGSGSGSGVGRPKSGSGEKLISGSAGSIGVGIGGGGPPTFVQPGYPPAPRSNGMVLAPGFPPAVAPYSVVFVPYFGVGAATPVVGAGAGSSGRPPVHSTMHLSGPGYGSGSGPLSSFDLPVSGPLSWHSPPASGSSCPPVAAVPLGSMSGFTAAPGSSRRPPLHRPMHLSGPGYGSGSGSGSGPGPFSSFDLPVSGPPSWESPPASGSLCPLVAAAPPGSMSGFTAAPAFVPYPAEPQSGFQPTIPEHHAAAGPAAPAMIPSRDPSPAAAPAMHLDDSEPSSSAGTPPHSSSEPTPTPPHLVFLDTDNLCVFCGGRSVRGNLVSLRKPYNKLKEHLGEGSQPHVACIPSLQIPSDWICATSNCAPYYARGDGPKHKCRKHLLEVVNEHGWTDEFCTKAGKLFPNMRCVHPERWTAIMADEFKEEGSTLKLHFNCEKGLVKFLTLAALVSPVPAANAASGATESDMTAPTH